MPRKAKKAGVESAPPNPSTGDEYGGGEVDRTGELPPAGWPAALPYPEPPRDLITAYLLLLLRDWNMHGYQLMQQLMMFGYQPTDPGSIYRQLRQLEKQGYIHSAWETGDAGPARRTYSLTEAGNGFLGTWATAIENYQKTLKFWTDLYAGIINPRPKPPHG